MNNIDSIREKAFELKSAGNYLAAAILLKSVTSLVPDDAPAWIQLSDSYRYLGMLSRARAALANALVHMPAEKKWIVYARYGFIERRTGMYDVAEKWFAKAANEPNSQVSSELPMERAKNLIRMEEYQTAETIMRAAMDSDCHFEYPDEPYKILGLALLGQDKFHEAKNAFTKANELASDQDESHFTLMSVTGFEEAERLSHELLSAMRSRN